MKKKLFLLCLLSFVLFIPSTCKAYTSDFDVDNEGYKLIHTYEELKTAAAYGTGADKFRLANNITETDSKNDNEISLNSSHLNLDLNGYTLERNTNSTDFAFIRIMNDAVLELHDSSPQKSGTIEFSNGAKDDYGIIVNSGGTLHIYEGNYILSDPLSANEACVLLLESGQTTIYDGFFDCRKTSGENILLQQYNYMISPPHCDIYGGKFYAKYNNIDISPNGSYLKNGSLYSTVYVMGGEFYFTKKAGNSGGFAYCNNGWGNVYVLAGTIPQYSLNVSNDVEYLTGTRKYPDTITVDGHTEQYNRIFAPPMIVSKNLPYEDRLLDLCMHHEARYIAELNPLFYKNNKDIVDTFIKTPMTLEVGKYTGTSPELSIEGLTPQDTVKWYFAYDYNGETASWKEIDKSFDMRPDEETTCYVKAVITYANGSRYEDIIALHYEKWDKTLQGNPIIYMNNVRYGNNIYAGILNAPEGQDKSTYTYKWYINYELVGTEEKISLNQEKYIGKPVYCEISSTKHTGSLVTPTSIVQKAHNNGQPQFPNASYNVSKKEICLTDVKSDQEYLFTTKSNLADLTEDDWFSAKKPVDSTIYSSLSNANLSGQEGKLVYIYTRMKETGTHCAGTKVLCVPLRLSDNIYLNNLLFKDAINGTIYLPFTQKGDLVDIEYFKDPINAQQWNNLYFRTLSSSVVTLASPTGAVTPDNMNGIVTLRLVGTGSADLQAYQIRQGEEQLTRIRINVYDPANPSIGSENVTTPIPDVTVKAGTSFIPSLPEFVPSLPESLKLSWFFIESDLQSTQRFTECDVATINSETGEIRALAPGKVNVALMKPDGNGYYTLDEFTLTVVAHDGYILVDKVFLSQTSLTLRERESAYLEATASPANASNQSVTWRSSNESVAKVDANGRVLGISEGTAKITATIYNMSASCTVSVTNGLIDDVGQPIANPFTDVKENDYFYDAVLWAVENGITSGISPTSFGPNNSCTRAQAVTFLWRAYGKPAPSGSDNPFRDVKSSDYYYEAVLWAVENGITTGISPTSFGPDSRCTRGQIVTFLHRSAGKPAPSGSDNPFRDVKSSDYYYEAVLWAVENGITTGVSSTSFAPNSYCTRGQIVCFLHRYIAK